jgi:uncharacterized protein YeeX (DUF496 family)
MNFDERDSHWENFLQDKANLSQSFCKDSCCRVCLCLELLKLSICRDGCYRPQEEKELVDRLLEGILDSTTFSIISDRLKSHFDNLIFVSGFQEKLSELESSLRLHTQKMIDLDISTHLEKLNKAEKNSENPKLESLINRIDSYEDTLIHLRKENDELRQQLKKAISIHEEYILSNRKSGTEIRTEFEHLREEQNKIRTGIESITKSVGDNLIALKEVKNLRENYKDDMGFAAIKIQIVEDQKEFIERAQNSIKKLQEAGNESEKRLEETWSQIQDLKKEHDAIQSWQKECKVLSRHSSHLLSASDSVYSSLQQLQDFNHVIQEKLEILKKNVEIASLEKKNLVIEEFYHTGLYNYDDDLQKYCWSCCKATQESRGCQKKFKINE